MPPVFKKPLVSDARVALSSKRWQGQDDVPRMAVACRLKIALLYPCTWQQRFARACKCMTSQCKGASTLAFACTTCMQAYDPTLAERTLANTYSQSEQARDEKKRQMLQELVSRGWEGACWVGEVTVLTNTEGPVSVWTGNFRSFRTSHRGFH